MKPRVESAIVRVTEVLSGWSCVEAISLRETMAEGFYDPYFFLSFDVYVDSGLPPAEARVTAFPFAGAFEASDFDRKDRFLVDEIPVRVEFRDIDRVRDLVRLEGPIHSMLNESGTYLFHRIENSKCLYQRSDLLIRLQAELKGLPDSFWTKARRIAQTPMEHYLSDLGAAVIREDGLFFLLSASGFIRKVCSALFAVNRRFEPSARMLNTETRKLPVLPEPFVGRFDSFLRNDPEISPARKHEIAGLMARSIINLE